jgi:membrane protease YdiL (CAAX protease family)
MEERERYVAAGLFVVTALALPILFHGAPDAELSAEQAPFLMKSAYLELKLDAAMAAFSNGEEPPLLFFEPETWIETAEAFPAPEKARFLRRLSVACRTIGRDADADRLLPAGKPEDAEPFVWLLNGVPLEDRHRLTSDLEVASFPGWMSNILQARAVVGAATLAPLAEGQLQAELEDWLSTVALLFGGLGLMLLAGSVLLARSRTWILRPDEGRPLDSLGGFGAGPVQTWMLFAGWFLLNGAAAYAVPVLRESLSRAGLMMFLYAVTAVLGVLLVKWRGGPRREDLATSADVDTGSLTPRAVWLGALAYLAALPLVTLLNVASAMLLGSGEEGVNPAIPVLVDAEASGEMLLMTINVVLVAPLFEEFFFRGFLFQQFRRYFGTMHGVALSALVFAAVHTSMESFLPLFGLGVMLALVYHATRSLWASIVTHALWNFGTVAIVLVLFD